MSKRRSNYEETFSYKLKHFVEGDLESSEQELTKEELAKLAPKEHHGHGGAGAVHKTENDEMHFAEIVERDPLEDAKKFAEIFGFRWFHRIYNISAVILCVCIIAMLVATVVNMPPHGSSDSPTNNEVADRYLQKGLEETGSPNLVTGMILQYRAFDTFGETNVLFISTCTVMILLMVPHKHGHGKKKEKEEAKAEAEASESEEFSTETKYEPAGDVILQMAARLLVPMIFVFGFYILVNGHLSPGGGFSGGAIMGAALILYCAAFGFTKTARFFDEKIYEIIKVGSLCIYAMIITYYLFTGANGIASIVPLGKVGNIISAGLILPINVLVGLEVACTMYAFYAFFRKGGF